MSYDRTSKQTNRQTDITTLYIYIYMYLEDQDDPEGRDEEEQSDNAEKTDDVAVSENLNDFQWNWSQDTAPHRSKTLKYFKGCSVWLDMVVKLRMQYCRDFLKKLFETCKTFVQ